MSISANNKRENLAEVVTISLALVTCWCFIIAPNRCLHFKGNITFVLMPIGIINGYQLLCDDHTVPQLWLVVVFNLLHEL